MEDQNKTKKQLVDELMDLRQRIAELEGSKIKSNQAAQELRRTEWLLNNRVQTNRKDYVPPYGNLVKINTCRLILDSVGEEVLREIVGDYLDLLDTSGAIYEKNGDYALGIFSSNWCRVLDQASRNLCRTDNNREALDCGKWHCHESCWSEASKVSIATGQPVDIECKGGIRLFAVPIWAGGEIVGSINFGYGNPPRDQEELHAIAERYGIGIGELLKCALEYESRPPFIIDIAKNRLLTSARLIGEIIERKRAEEALQEKTHELGERVKESCCLYALSKVIEKPDISLPEIFEGTLTIIPRGWQYPEVTCARLVFEDQIFKTPNFNQTIWKQSSPILVNGRSVGTLEVYYLEEKPECDEGPFLKEERDLIDALVGQLGKTIQRKRVEEALRTERQRLYTVLEVMPVMVCLLTSDYHVAFANRAFREKFGESHGRHCYEYCFGKKEPCDFCETYRVFKTGKPHHWEVTTPDSATVIDVYDFPFKDVDGSPLILQIDIDITESKRAEEALHRSHEELEMRVQERTAELQESENRFRVLCSQLLTIQEKERKRLAQELHDGIGQMLTAIKFRVENIQQQEGERKTEAREESIESIIPMIKDSMEELPRIQMNLWPPILDDLGILATIRWFCREFQKVYSAIHIEKEIEIQEDEVSVPLKTVIYRVMQEAMNNIAQYSQADVVHLFLKKVGGRIEFVIQDNGIGFDLEKSKRGLGLGSMKERTELSGGTFAVESIKGKGTVIHASWLIK